MIPRGEVGVGDMMAPSLRRRMACFLYEAMLLFGVALIPGAIGAVFTALTGQQHALQGESALRWIAFAIYAIYFTAFWSLRGQTLPMQTWHIKVVTREGKPLTQSRALARFLASCVWFAPASLIASLNGWTGWEHLVATAVGIVAYALLALLHPRRQFWHDALCRTRLVTAMPRRQPSH